MALSDHLVNYHIQAHPTSLETDSALSRFTDSMSRFFWSQKAQELRTQDPLWNLYVQEDGGPIANVRIATVDLEALCHGYLVYLKQTDADPREHDGGMGKEYSAKPPYMEFGLDTIQAMGEYLHCLAFNELKDVLGVSQEALGTTCGRARRGTVSVDYYSDRSVATHRLHKDTAGITLFVALHYLNEAEMLGPEYIIDRWPLPVTGDPSTYRFYRRKYLPFDIEQGRQTAPWKRVGDSRHYFWPRGLIDELEAARAVLRRDYEDEALLSHVNLPPFGLVSFVDELIYHATPLGRQRDADETNRMYRGVYFSSTNYPILPSSGYQYHENPEDGSPPYGEWAPRLNRTISQSILKGSPIPGVIDHKKGKGVFSRFRKKKLKKRSFLRLWISICDRNWYEEIPG